MLADTPSRLAVVTYSIILWAACAPMNQVVEPPDTPGRQPPSSSSPTLLPEPTPTQEQANRLSEQPLAKVSTPPPPPSQVPSIPARPGEAAADSGALPPPNSQSDTTFGSSYVVQPNDNLTDIARCFGVSIDSIVALNQIPNRHLIRQGRALVLPATALAIPSDGKCKARRGNALSGPIYRVKRGEVLETIAQTCNVTVGEIVALNDIPDRNHIEARQVLSLPAHAKCKPLVQPNRPVVEHDRVAHVTRAVSSIPQVPVVQPTPPTPVVKPVELPRQVSPEVQVVRGCESKLLPNKLKNRTVFFANGVAGELFERYLRELRTADIDVKYDAIRIHLFDENNKQQMIEFSPVSQDEMLAFYTAKTKWGKILRSRRAARRTNPAEDARLLNADLICGN